MKLVTCNHAEPGRIELLDASRRSDKTASVSWKSLTLVEARGWILNFTVYYWESGNQPNTAQSIVVNANINSTTVTELDPYTAYRVAVAASTRIGKGERSKSFTVAARKTRNSGTSTQLCCA